MPDQTPATAPKQPTIYDSDLIRLAIHRLERVAEKMQRREYDQELDQELERAAEMFQWVGWNIANRATRDDLTDKGDASVARFVELARTHDSGRGECACDLCETVRALGYSTHR